MWEQTPDIRFIWYPAHICAKMKMVIVINCSIGGDSCMKLWKRIITNFIVFLIVYIGVTFFVEHSIDLKKFALISITYLSLSFVIYLIIDKISKEERNDY